MLNRLLAYEQERFLYSLLRTLPKKLIAASKSSEGNRDFRNDTAVAGAAALLAGITDDNNKLRDELVTWLIGNPGGGIGGDLSIRRAAFAALSLQTGMRPLSHFSAAGIANVLKEAIQVILEKGMRTFGDELFVKHSPILHQEGY